MYISASCKLAVRVPPSTRFHTVPVPVTVQEQLSKVISLELAVAEHTNVVDENVALTPYKIPAVNVNIPVNVTILL